MVYRGAGVLCPFRIKAGTKEKEVLLGKRSFWNPEYNTPMRFPGEWMLIGGYREARESPKETAIREFKEETNYTSEIKKLKLFSNMYRVYAFSAEIDQDYEFNNLSTDELIEVKCDTIPNWFRFIQSREFTREQNREIKRRKLDDKRYAGFSVFRRYVPDITLNQLKNLEWYFSDKFEDVNKWSIQEHSERDASDLLESLL